MRAEGYYWVKRQNEEWEVGKFHHCTWTYSKSYWEVHGEEKTLSDSDFSEIDERPIVREELKCRSALEEMCKLYEAVSDLGYSEVVKKYHFEISQEANLVAQYEFKKATRNDVICETYRGVKIDLIDVDGFEVRLVRN